MFDNNYCQRYHPRKPAADAIELGVVMAKKGPRGSSRMRSKSKKRSSPKGDRKRLERILKQAIDYSAQEMRTEIEAERLPADLLTLHFR